MLSAIHYVRDLHEQSALLLKTADAILNEHNFGPYSGNMCIWESGQTHMEPFKWMPSEVVRYYTSVHYSRVIAFVSILFSDRHGEYVPPLSECLFTAGAAIFKTADWNEKDWQRSWWGRFHGYFHDRHNDGRVEENPISSWDDCEDYPKLDRILTIGRPLYEIVDGNTVKTALAPLFERIEGTVG